MAPRLVWRVRPFMGGIWSVLETSRMMMDFLITNVPVGSSYEVQLVEMTQQELEQLPVHK
jgi:hypothetical protein